MNFTKESLTDLTRNLMDFHDLHDWKIRIGTAKNFAGMCDFSRKQITMSLFLANARSRENTVDTILHEIAHALTPKDGGHGKEWKAVASRIGANPSRCFDRKEIDPALAYKYHGRCPTHIERTTRRNRRAHIKCLKCDSALVWRDLQSDDETWYPFESVSRLNSAIEKYNADLTDDGCILAPIGHTWNATGTHYLDPTLSYYTETDSGRERSTSRIHIMLVDEMHYGLDKCNCRDCLED